MAASADSIDDLDVIRSGGMKKVFGGVDACATLGSSCVSSRMAMSANLLRCCAGPWSPSLLGRSYW
jgi:hypothetical protein